MNYEKAVYFVTTEKTVQHVGFTTQSQMHLLESRELLEQHGFREDPPFVRATDDSVYVFSSLLPPSVVDVWFDQILNERSKLKNAERKKGKSKINTKRQKERKKSIEEKERLKRKVQKIERSAEAIKKPPKTNPRSLQVKKSSHAEKSSTKKDQKRVVPKKTQKRKKTPDMLKEEVKAQRRWESFVPTCGECIFWEKQYLKFTQTEIGGCGITGNFVSREKKACSEFERQ